eukprot:1195331-Prorocentrum_minimum.AAC.7
MPPRSLCTPTLQSVRRVNHSPAWVNPSVRRVNPSVMRVNSSVRRTNHSAAWVNYLFLALAGGASVGHMGESIGRVGEFTFVSSRLPGVEDIRLDELAWAVCVFIMFELALYALRAASASCKKDICKVLNAAQVR